MTGFYVRVPAETAQDLRRDGFVVRGPDRGAGEIFNGVEVALGVLGSAVALGADSVTMLVARHQVKRFFKQLWSRADGGDTTKPTLRRIAVIVSKDGVQRSVTLEAMGFEYDPPDAVVNAFADLIEGLTDPNPGLRTERFD